MKPQGLPGSARIKGEVTAANIFQNAERIYDFPFVCYHVLVKDDASNLRVLFAVPKKRFRKAYRRNLIRRRMREAFRKNKFCFAQILSAQNINVHIAFVYNSSEEIDYWGIEDKIIVILNRLSKIYAKAGS